MKHVLLAIVLVTLGFLTALAVWGQPVKELAPQQWDQSRTLVAAPVVHYRCEKQKDGTFRFVPIDCDDCSAVILSCTNCSCEGEK